MRTSLPVVLCLFAFAVVGGCVPYKTYDVQKKKLRRAAKINEDLVAKLNHMVHAYSGLQGTEGFGSTTVENLQARLRLAQQTNETLQQKLGELSATPAAVIRFDPTDVENIPGVEYNAEKGSLILGDIEFNSGMAALKAASRRTLDGVANLLSTKYHGELFHIVGHTDNVPLAKTRGRWKTNLNLGFHRAYMVFEYLHVEHQIPESQFKIHTYGYLEPLDPATADTKAGRARNRRVEVYRSGARL